MARQTKIVAFMAAGLILWGAAFSSAAQMKTINVPADDHLVKHSAIFKKQVIKVADNVYLAVGYGLANSALIVGTDGVIVIDTMESASAAREVLAAFKKISPKPVKAIIYTHFHADHIGGAAVFAAGRKIPVIANALTPVLMARTATVIRPIIYKRAMRMFGVLLPQGGLVNAGIGPRLRFGPGEKTASLRPTRLYRDRLAVEIAGVKLVLIHAPGETDDQTVIWYPARKIIFAADNIYPAFPNLYTIRGTSYRDVTRWVASLDKMRALPAEILVPMHGRPISGAKFIHQKLTNYRDAIQFVHDQTVRLINQGLGPDQIVARLKLPPHLAADPWLREYYGMVGWSIRSIFTGYLGWYSGRGRDLFPLTPRARASRMAALAGGIDKLAARAKDALDKKDFQWALELADDVLIINPAHKVARRIKTAALIGLASGHVNANARNYLLSLALENKGDLCIRPMDPSQMPAKVIHSLPLAVYFKLMPVFLNPAKAVRVDMKVVFYFPDLKKDYTIHVRRGVAEITPGAAADPALKVTMDSRVFKDILSRRTGPMKAMASGQIKVQGPPMKFLMFLSNFQ
jgi:alkyl sulfatase BDS1-like metallo-beta-lactamase superfamily hydrolase